jgi:hypothetical protein
MKHAQRVWGWPSWSPSGIYALLLILLLLTGCASASTTKQVAPTPTTTAVATIPAPLLPTTLQKAWGNVTIHALPSGLPDNRVFVFLNAATPDGQWLIGANEPRDFIANTTRLSYAVLYNIATQQMVTMHALLHPQSQILAASADDRWVVWSEADDQPDFFDWALFAYDRQSGQVRQLGQAALNNGKPVQGPSPMPVVDHGKVIWGQPIGPVSPGTLDNAVVRMDDLATGQVTTLATKAGNPYLAWPWVAWGQITTGSNGYVTLKNLETGQSEQLPAQPASLEIVGMSVAYDDTTSVFLINDIAQGTDHQQILATAANVTDHLQFVSLNDRLVAWSQSTVTQVWDRALRRLVVLPVINGESDSWVGGRTLVWLEPEPKAQQDQDTRNGLTPTPTFKVIDTTTLPAAPGA